MRNLRDTRTRAEKLRDMAEHPTANEHEAANARAELRRLVAGGVPDPALPVAYAFDAAFDRDLERWAREAGRSHVWEEIKRERIAKRERGRWYEEELRRYPRRERSTTASLAWVATLRPGDKVRSLHSVSLYDGPPLPSEVHAVARRTPSGIVVMADGSKWNAKGYKRGETGREGYRTFIVPA